MQQKTYHPFQDDAFPITNLYLVTITITLTIIIGVISLTTTTIVGVISQGTGPTMTSTHRTMINDMKVIDEDINGADGSIVKHN